MVHKAVAATHAPGLSEPSKEQEDISDSHPATAEMRLSCADLPKERKPSRPARIGGVGQIGIEMCGVLRPDPALSQILDDLAQTVLPSPQTTIRYP
jgi:hypothetical protein